MARFRKGNDNPHAAEPRNQVDSSVQLESAFVIVLERSVLLSLLQIKIAYDQNIELGTHEATKGLFGCAHDWLSADVEAGIDYNRAAGLVPEGR